jgi:glycosyltransferase involved in cell wall biosynthesis
MTDHLNNSLLRQERNNVSGVRVVYPYPWFSPRFQHKDVVLFPQALAGQLLTGVEIIKGPFVLGEESADMGPTPRRIALAVNMSVASTSFWLRCLFWRKRLRSELTVFFNFNLISAILAWLFSLTAPHGHRFIVKADLNPRDGLFVGQGAGARIRRKLIAAMFARAHATVVVETNAALATTRACTEFSRLPLVLCRNGVETGIENAPTVNRDIDVLVVTRYNAVAKAAHRYFEVFKELRPGLKIAIVGVGAEAAVSEKRSAPHLLLLAHDMLAHEQVVQLMLRSKVFLNLSAQESFCLALMEAAESGCRIISTDVGVAADLGSFYPHIQVMSFDPELLAAEVHRAIDTGATNAVCPGRFAWDEVLRMDCLVEKLLEISPTPTPAVGKAPLR